MAQGSLVQPDMLTNTLRLGSVDTNASHLDTDEPNYQKHEEIDSASAVQNYPLNPLVLSVS